MLEKDCLHKIFRASPLPSLLLKPDVPRFTIVDANTAYLTITGTHLNDLEGKGIFEAFPDNPANPEADGVKNLRSSLLTVLETCAPHKMATQRYDIPIRGSDDFGQRYYSPENVPVLDDDGKVVMIIHTVTDISERVFLQKADSLARIGSWEFNLDNGTSYWSEITRELYGVTSSFRPSVEDSILFCKEGESRDLLRERLMAAVEHGAGWDEELEIITTAGKEKWVRIIGETDFAGGVCKRLYGSLQDIDARKNAETIITQALIEKSEILESIGDAFFTVDNNWVVTYWNKVAAQVLQMPKQEIVGRNLWQVFPNSVGSFAYTKYLEAANTRQPAHFETYSVPFDKWYEVSAYPSVKGLSIYFKDITVRKLFEIKQKEAAESQALFVSIVNSSDDAIISKTLAGIITSWNGGAEKLFGYTSAEAIGKHISIIIPKTLMDEEAQIIDKIWHGKFVKHYETQRLRKDGHIVEVSLTVSPVFDENGNITGASKIARDITEKKKAADAIRLSNERYNLVAKATNDSIWDWDILTGTVTRTGEGFTRMFGYTIEESAADPLFWSKKVHPEDITRVLNLLQLVFNEPKTFYWEDEYRVYNAKGKDAYVYDKGYILRDETGRAIRMIGATQDITQQKEQIIEIRRIQQNLYSLINNTRDLIWSVNKDLKIIAANKAYSDAIEVYTGEPVMEGDDAILKVFGSELVEKWTALYRRALAGEYFGIEEIFTHPATGKVWYAAVSYSPIVNREGLVIGTACFAKDITDLKKAANDAEEMNKVLAKKAEELAISNAELEQFAYVASHDLQEPLRMVTSFLTQLQKKYGNIIDDKGKQYIHFAVDGAKRMRQIILDLLEFSRVGKTEDSKEDVDLNELLYETKLLFGRQIEEKKASLQYNVLPVVHSYKAALRQVFQNLIGNALKYSAKQGEPVIIVRADDFETFWQFMVADNGIGINEEYFNKIFIIFQRLHNKDEYSGTGMGLAIAKKIVENMGGKIWVESEEGKGSRFYFTIPKN
jgi:PAS domain S-box-containing protein